MKLYSPDVAEIDGDFWDQGNVEDSVDLAEKKVGDVPEGMGEIQLHSRVHRVVDKPLHKSKGLE